MEAAAKAELLEKLRATHGTVFEIEDEDFGLVVFRRPNKLEFRAFKMARDDDNLKAVADEQFAVKVVVHPSAEAFTALLDQFPVLATNIAGQAMAKAGGGKLDVKKH